MRAWVIALIYAALGLFWIVGSSNLATFFVSSASSNQIDYEVGKGVIFVAATALGLLLLLHREFRQREKAETQRFEVMERHRRILDQSVKALGLAIEKRDPYTGGHQIRVASLSKAIGRRLGLNAGQLEAIRLGALMHDIGKIGIPAEILNKPGRLEPAEFELIKRHPAIGHDIVRHVDLLPMVHRVVLEHHERMDGRGYPAGCIGNEICMEARVVAVADVVEAITSHRPYRPALGLDAARAELIQNRGTAFDAVVVDACLAVIDDGFQFGEAGAL